MNNKAKRLTTVGMLCTIAYVVAAVGRIPLVLFLLYDPKDIIIAIGRLNASITMILYQPVVTALRRSHLIEFTQVTEKKDD